MVNRLTTARSIPSSDAGPTGCRAPTCTCRHGRALPGSRTRLSAISCAAASGSSPGARPAWIHTPVRTYGFGSGILRCGQVSGSQGPVPAFQPDPLQPPAACAGGGNGTLAGDVELLDPRLRMARTLRMVLAWDHRLGGDLLATAEALYTRNLSDFMFVNLNLVGPQSTDGQGRTLYGTIAAAGQAAPARRTTSFLSVIDLQNISANHAIQLAARLEKRFAGGVGALASYTWSRVRDVQTPLRVNNRGVINWSSRAVSGLHEDRSTGISLNDIPHRIVLAGTWRAPWQRWTTELSLLYVGESGARSHTLRRASAG